MNIYLQLTGKHEGLPYNVMVTNISYYQGTTGAGGPDPNEWEYDDILMANEDGSIAEPQLSLLIHDPVTWITPGESLENLYLEEIGDAIKKAMSTNNIAVI